jgi:hypothetical protein
MGTAPKMVIDDSGNVGILGFTGIIQIIESGNTAFYGGNYVRMETKAILLEIPLCKRCY